MRRRATSLAGAVIAAAIRDSLASRARAAPQTNSLTIAKDGTIFGVYHNGQQCTVNGRVDLIDARFNLYRFEFSFSSCQVFQQYEGQTLTGLAARSLPGTAANSFMLLITGVIDGRLESISVTYEPA